MTSGVLLPAGLWSGIGAAQPAAAPIVIGRLHPGSDDAPLRAYIEGFTQGMRSLGYVEGRDYRIELRTAEGDPSRLGPLAADLVRSKVDLIIGHGVASVRAARQATQSIPIVMAMSGPDPVGAGLIASLARPGGNVTGLTGQTDELAVKQLELLRELTPRLSDLLVLFNPRGSTLPDGKLRATASALRLSMHNAAISSAGDLTPAFARVAPERSWAVVALADPAVIDRLRSLIAERALQHRLPSSSSFRAGATAGQLLSYGIDLADMHRQSASFVVKILKGALPADLPTERPTKFELVLNLKTARAIGLAVPSAILARADEVIE
jgi:putative ABC transport system substrate-binding protein